MLCSNCGKELKESRKPNKIVLCKKCRRRKYYEEKNHRQWALVTLNYHKSRGFIISIDVNELERIAKESIFCPVCSKKMNWKRGKKGMPMDNSPSLARLTDDRILTLENTRIECMECNSIQNSKTWKEFLEYCKIIVKKFG